MLIARGVPWDVNLFEQEELEAILLGIVAQPVAIAGEVWWCRFAFVHADDFIVALVVHDFQQLVRERAEPGVCRGVQLGLLCRRGLEAPLESSREFSLVTGHIPGAQEVVAVGDPVRVVFII